VHDLAERAPAGLVDRDQGTVGGVAEPEQIGQTVESSCSCAWSVTITKSQCWLLRADGERQPASSIRSISASGIGAVV
jgi:hypothetical protein